MLTLSPKHMQVFAETSLESFEGRMLHHLTEFFPKQCEVADEEQLRAIIRYGIKRAAAYGIVAERDVCKYIDLMILFGRDFDRDPDLDSQRATLQDTHLQDPVAKLGRLYEAAFYRKGHPAKPPQPIDTRSVDKR